MIVESDFKNVEKDFKLESKSILKVLLLLAISLCPFFASSQASFQYFNINKIRSNEVIKSICKDDKGFIWLATDQGVLRFDGNETYMFLKELPSPYAKKFLKRKNGEFLVVTDFGIRKIMHSEDSTFFKPLVVQGQPFLESLNYPKSAFEDKDENIWLGEVESLVRISSSGVHQYPLGSEYRSINYHRSFTFVEDAFGNLWIAPYKGRLLFYNREKDRLEDVDIDYPLTEVSCMVNVKGDNLIIGGKEGLLRLKVDSDHNILVNDFIKGPEGISAALAIDNEIYLGTWDKGLYFGQLFQDTVGFERIEELPFNDVLDFYHDEDQSEIWITGSENLGILKPSIVKPIVRAGKIRIESLSSDSLGSLYFSSGQQIYKIAPGEDERPKQVVGSKSTYLDRVLWDTNKLWIGGAFGNIAYFDLETKTLINLWDSTANAIQYILKDSRGGVWFTGHSQSLKRIDPQLNFKNYKSVKKSAVIKESPDSMLFCGAQGRDSLLYTFDWKTDKFSLASIDFDFLPTPNIQVEDIAFDSLNYPWLATNEGLLRVVTKNGKFKAERIPLKGIDVNEPIKAIAIVSDHIWLSYSFGLVVYHKGEIITYTRENGLPSRLLKERGLYLQNDKLYVATAKGLAEIDVNFPFYRKTNTPLLKSMFINGSKFHVSGNENSVLPYGARAQIDYVSLSYPGNNMVYQTRVLGLEDNWGEPSPNNSISILGFSEGNYTLEVRAREDGKLWSEPLLFSFSVSSPWFKQWWVIVVFIIAGTLAIYGTAKVYHYHLVRQRRRLKKTIEERTAEINEQKNQIIEQKNKIIQQKEELIEKNNAVYHSQKALSEADVNYLHLKEKQLQDQIEYRNKQITTHTLNIIQKNEMLRDLKYQLEEIIKTHEGLSQNELKKLLKIIDESFRHDKDWDEFKIYFEQIYSGFYAKLKVNYPDLTNQELRHCALIRLNLRNSECASILGIAPNSIKVSRNRLKKKLNLEAHESLTDFLISL